MNSKIEHSKDNTSTGGDIVKYAAATILVLAGLLLGTGSAPLSMRPRVHGPVRFAVWPLSLAWWPA